MKVQDIKPAHKRTLEDDLIERSRGSIEREFKVLKAKYQQTLERVSAVDRLVEKAQDLIVSYQPMPLLKRKVLPAKKGSPESAVLMLSDSHVGQVVKGNQTLGFGDYNFQRFAERLKYIEDRVVSILANNINTKIDELVIFMLGDMLHGNLAHSKEITRGMTLFDQWHAASHCYSQFLLHISQHVEKIRIYSAVGNHSRFGNQKKMPTEQRYSNFDHFLYAMVKQMVSRQSNIYFNLDNQPFCYVDIKGSKFLGMHGDHLRGGDKQMGVPIHSIARQLSGMTQLYESRGLEAPHYWLMGDKHRKIDLPTVKGEWMVNGSFVGDDNFSLTLATSSDPMQRFFGVHPKYRTTWSYNLKVKHAPALREIPYQLAPELIDSLV